MGNTIEVTTKKLLVCIGPSANSAKLVHTTHRIATDRKVPWIALYVESPRMLMLPEKERFQALETLRLAEQLGAEVVTLSGPNIADEILDFASKRKVTQIIVGKPQRRSLWKSSFWPSPVDHLIRMSGEIDVYVIRGEAGVPTPSMGMFSPKPVSWGNTALRWLRSQPAPVCASPCSPSCS